MYIQDKMEEYADEIFGLLDQVSQVACMESMCVQVPCWQLGFSDAS